VLPLLLLMACKAPAGERQAATAAGVVAIEDTGCGADGRLRGSLFGSLDATIDWRPPALACESMPRPGHEGMRLRFAGPAGGRVLTLIVAIPGLQRGLTANALPANVTLTVEGSGRFFNTPNLEACFVDITQHEPRDAGTHAVGGLLYCVLPLGEINGDGAVTIQDMVFSGTADWGTS